MVKTPKTRHSKAHRDPVTIDLGPEEVSRIAEPTPDAGKESAAGEDAAAAEAPDAAGEAPAAAAPDAAAEPSHEAQAEAKEPAGDKSLDDELSAKIGSEPPYASAFGRSASEQTDIEKDTPGGAGRGLLAGLVGGVIALLGAGALQYSGFLPAPGNGETNSLRTEIGVLRQEIDGLKDNAGLADAEELRNVLSDSNARIDGLAASLDKVESDLASLRDAASSGGAGDGAAVQALNQKVTELESALAALRGGGGTEALDALNERIASVEGALAAARTASDAADARLGALEQEIAGISEKIEQQAGQPRVALAIAASGLKAALERGGPFSAELDTFAAVAPDAPELPELRPLAEQGVRSRADLVAAASDAANAMIDASQVIDENAGILDRLLASAKSLVKMRPTGAVEGEGVPEKVARLEAAVKEGNLAKALAEYDTLPEASRAAGAGFADSLRGRLKVEELVDKALAGALKPA